MIDIVDRNTRSKMMSGISGKNTQPELVLRRALHHLGLRYRIHHSSLPGRPDVVLPKYDAVILVHGCFWHRHKKCVFATMPASNTSFWKTKFKDTELRDARNLMKLSEAGWRAAVVWECAFNDQGPAIIAERLARWLAGNRRFIEIPRTPRNQTRWRPARKRIKGKV